MDKVNLKTSEAEATKLLCVFCYRAIQHYDDSEHLHHIVSGNSEYSLTRKLKICDKFYNQIQLPPNNYLLSKNNNKKSRATEMEDDDNDSTQEDFNVEKVASLWNTSKYGICDDCFYAVDTYAKLFEKMEILQRRLRWQMDKLHRVMKAAVKIESRVKEFQNNITGDKDQDSVINFRKKVYRTCRRKLKEGTVEKNENFTSKRNSSHASHKVHSSSKQKTDCQQTQVKPSTSAACQKSEIIAGEYDDNEDLLLLYKTIPIKAINPNKKGQRNKKTLTTRSSRQLKKTSSAPDSLRLFKCTKCFIAFPSLEALTSHLNEKHSVVCKEKSEKVAGNKLSSDDDKDEQGVVLQSTARTSHGSMAEQRGLEVSLNFGLTNNTELDCPDSDTEVKKNWSELKKIVKSLRPHGQSEKIRNNLKLSQTCSRKRLYSNSKTRERSVSCNNEEDRCSSMLLDSTRKKMCMLEPGKSECSSIEPSCSPKSFRK